MNTRQFFDEEFIADSSEKKVCARDSNWRRSEARVKARKGGGECARTIREWRKKPAVVANAATVFLQRSESTKIDEARVWLVWERANDATRRRGKTCTGQRADGEIRRETT